MNINKGLALSLAACMSISPIMVMAENIDATPISAPIIAPEERVMETEYIHFYGKIEEIKNEDGKISILVKNDITEGGLNALQAFVNEDVILLDDEDMDFADKDELKVGMMVSIYYHKDTIMALSYPPMLGPDAIVINNTDKEPIISVMVSRFDKELLNAEKDMIIRPADTTVIVDKDGEKVDKEDLADRDLIVFYDIVLESYPGQTSPKKIVVIPEREEIEAPEEVNEFILESKFIKVVDGVKMIPLRLVGESLGYEVKWNQDTKSVELVKGAQWTSVTIGQDNYSFAKMLVKLGTAPALIDSTTYVPLNFIDEILTAKTQVIEDGSVRIEY